MRCSERDLPLFGTTGGGFTCLPLITCCLDCDLISFLGAFKCGFEDTDLDLLELRVRCLDSCGVLVHVIVSKPRFCLAASYPLPFDND